MVGSRSRSSVADRDRSRLPQPVPGRVPGYPKETERVDDFWVKLKALLAAVPYWGAVATSILTAVGTEVVPLLPDNVGVRVAVVVALALGWVATIVRVVSRVTAVPVDARGLVVAPGDKLTVELAHPGGGSSAITTTG